MKVKLSHIVLLVKNLDKARNFYGNILGFQEIDRPPFSIKGIWYNLGEFELHLMLYEQANPPQIHPLNETVQPHFALSITQNKMAKIVDKLKTFGTRFISESARSPTGVLQVFFYDDKNMIELNSER